MTTDLRFGMFLSQARRSWDDVLDDFLEAEDARVRPRVARRSPRRHGRSARGRLPRGVDAPRRDRGEDEPHPARRARVEQHVPQPGAPAQGGRHGRPHQRRPADPRDRHGLARGRAPPLRVRSPGPAERVDRFEEAVELISLLMAQERTTFHGRYYRARGRAPRAATGPAAAHPDPDRRTSAADAPDRGPVRGPVGHLRGDAGDGDRRASKRSSPTGSPRSTPPVGRSVGTRPRSGGRPGRRATCSAPRTPTSTSSAATIGSVSRTSRPSGPSHPTRRSCGELPPRSFRPYARGSCSTETRRGCTCGAGPASAGPTRSSDQRRLRRRVDRAEGTSLLVVRDRRRRRACSSGRC